MCVMLYILYHWVYNVCDVIYLHSVTMCVWGGARARNVCACVFKFNIYMYIYIYIEVR